MRCDSLYLAPHLDDAILSCAGRILQETAGGKRVVVATLFTHADAERAALYRRRRDEDRRAVAPLGAVALHAGLNDAPYRRSCYSSFRDIVLGSHPADGEDEAKAQLVIERLMRDCAAANVYCPLGVGTHIDHRLTYQAATRAAGAERLIFYEDRPYVFVRGQLAMRLAELSLVSDVAMPSPAEFLDSFRRAHYVRTYLDESSRSACEAVLLEKLRHAPGPGRRASAEIVAAEDIDNLLRAIALYETQFADLYDSIEGLRRESLAYSARELGVEGYAERYWRITGS
jgi:LmbE family N-acetylglucosaminyl deacetylase